LMPMGYPNVAPSPDGRRFAGVSGTNRLQVFDGTGNALWSVANVQAQSVHWSPDSRQLITTHPKEIAVRDAGTGKIIHTFTPSRGEAAFGHAVAFPPGGKQIKVTSALGERVDVIDLRKGERTSALPTGAAGIPALSPDGQVVAVDSGANLTVVNLISGEKRLIAKPKERSEFSMPPIRFSPDGALIVTCEKHGVAALRHPATAAEIRHLDLRSKATTCEFALSPQGIWLVLGESDGTLSLWDLSSVKQLTRWHGHHDRINTIAFAGPGRVVTSSADLTALLWDLRPKEPPTKPAWNALAGGDALEAYRAVWAVAADPKGAELLRTRIDAAKPAPAEQMRQWLADLGADKYPVREEAMRELQALGRLVEPELRAARAVVKSEEVRARVDAILAKIPQERSGTEVVHARAVAAMELAGTDAAKKVLTEWAGGAPGARLTIDAKAALERFGR
jgi:WD domain, G-beta repeat